MKNKPEDDSDVEIMSTQPYCGLTPPSIVSVRDSPSEEKTETFNNKDDEESVTSVVINTEDNLESLEQIKDHNKDSNSSLKVKGKSSAKITPLKASLDKTPTVEEKPDFVTPNNSILETSTSRADSAQQRKRLSSLSTPISKSLLTPCRRPGLSRKIKLDNRNNTVKPILSCAITETLQNKLELENTPKPIKEKSLFIKNKAKICQKEDHNEITSKFEISPNEANENKHTKKLRSSSTIKNLSHKLNGNKEKSQVFPLKSIQAVSCPTNSTDYTKSQENDRKSELGSTKKVQDARACSENKTNVTMKKSFKRLSMKKNASSDHDQSFDSTTDSIESINSVQNEIILINKKSRTHSNEEIDVNAILSLQNRVKVKREKLESLKRAEDLQKSINV